MLVKKGKREINVMILVSAYDKNPINIMDKKGRDHMRQLLISFLLIGVIIPGTIYFTSRTSHSAESPTTVNPISPTVPSEAAEDINTFQYESKHDVETESHSNTDPDDGNADDSKPIAADVVKKDVLNRFSDVYKQKKLQADKLQIDLTAAKDDLVACDKLSGTDKTKCVNDATNYIDVITQKISNLKYDMNIIQKEIKDIGQ